MGPPRVPSWGVVLLLGILTTAGCLGAAPPEDAGPAATPSVARQPGVEDPQRVIVDVIDPTGPTNRSIAGARVTFFTKVADLYIDTVYFDNVDGCPVHLDEPPFEVLVTGTTDEQGRVVGLVDPNADHPEFDFELPVYVAVGRGVAPKVPDSEAIRVLPRHTSEVYVEDLPGVSRPCGFDGLQRVGSPIGDHHITAPVYPTSVPFAVNGSLDATIAFRVPDVGPSYQAWFPQPIYDDRDHLARMHHVTAELQWANAPDSWADLYLGFGSEGDEVPRTVGEDHGQGPRDGNHEEELNSPASAGPVAVIGPVTDRPIVTTDGVDYSISGRLWFHGAAFELPT